ncbi:CaiF/GrlA family transcriptional regulator [Citrobacter freundii]|nr:CaiF/GrlA family transcriptional regulator [Citrobacter freundii]MBC6506690.1 CaiF/GrlA family transcriptional regulator [Citrobacter freundii]
MVCREYRESKGAYCLPAQMQTMEDLPLYLIVACWGLREKCVLSTDLVSQVFFISPARARDTLHYIRHEGRERVVSETLDLTDRRHPFCKGLRIVAVSLSGIAGMRKRKKSTADKARVVAGPGGSRSENRYELYCQLRQWMVSRRPGEPVPGRLLPGTSVFFQGGVRGGASSPE